MEVNNSALRYGKENPDKLLALLAQADFPEDLILNASAERVLSFIESRRARKTNQS